MISRWMRALAVLAMAPTVAFAFETVESLPWPSAGGFSGYPADPVHPWGLFIQGGVMRDSNVLRTPTDKRVEWITRVGAGIRSEGLIIGRQRALLEAIVEYYEYLRFDTLDHVAHGLRGEWLWEFTNDLSGTLGASRRKRLADIGEFQRAVRDLVTEDRLYASGAWRVGPTIRLTGGADLAHIEHDGRTVRDAWGYGVRGGAEYVTPLGTALGAEYRIARGDAPVVEELGLGAFPNNEYEEREIAATAAYTLGVDIGLRGRIGRTTRTYTELEGRDFKGTTWRGRGEWRVGPKTNLVGEFYKEPSAIVDTTALHVVRRGFAIGPAWAPTFKLVFTARYVNEERVFQGDPAVAVIGAPLLDEDYRFIRLGAGWEPQRHVQLGGAFDYGNRESNGDGRDYGYFAVTLNLRWTY
jgi:hypothetical protein